MKTEIYNLIILDESGSMGIVWRQTINGCNETIDTTKIAQEKFSDTQDHTISIYSFSSGGHSDSRYIIKNVPAAAAKHIDEHDYRPGGCTPLLDAVGACLVDLKATVAARESAIGSVTIITDGEENSSTHYTFQQVSAMISQLKELGWNFNFIGANIDVARYAQRLNIDNSLSFTQDEEGTKAMFARERSSRMAYHSRLDSFAQADAAACPDDITPENIEERKSRRLGWLKRASKGYFDDHDA